MAPAPAPALMTAARRPTRVQLLENEVEHLLMSAAMLRPDCATMAVAAATDEIPRRRLFSQLFIALGQSSRRYTKLLTNSSLEMLSWRMRREESLMRPVFLETRLFHISSMICLRHQMGNATSGVYLPPAACILGAPSLSTQPATVKKARHFCLIGMDASLYI